MTPDALTGGFSDAPRNAARAFRAILDALSRPGEIVTLSGATPPAPLSQAAGVLVLTLADSTTPVHLAGATDCPALRDWITFHTGAPLVGSADAAFAIGRWDDLQPVSRFAVGTPDYPDRSATLIVEMPGLAASGSALSGPGIAGTALLSLPETEAFCLNNSLFPLGYDCFFTQGDSLAGLPRSTQVRAV